MGCNMQYLFENGDVRWFSSLGGALEYAHKNITRLLRELP